MARAVLGSGLINVLDQTGQGVADFASEDHGDRVATILSDKAGLFTWRLPGDVQRIEGEDLGAPHLWTGFESPGSHDAAQEQRCRQWRSHGDAISHRGRNLLMSEKGLGTIRTIVAVKAEFYRSFLTRT
jgi:hypothetical protein